jgi:hypothetical protein
MSGQSVGKKKSCSWLRLNISRTNYHLGIKGDSDDDEWSGNEGDDGMDVVDDDSDNGDNDEDEDENEEYHEFEPIEYPAKYKKNKTVSGIRKRAVRMRVEEDAAPGVLAFLGEKGLLEYLLAVLGGNLEPGAAQTAFNRMASLLTWTWEKTGKNRAGLSTGRHIMRHLEVVFLSDRLDLVEAYTNHLRDECDVQSGTLANILHHIEKCFKWICTDIRRDFGYALGTVHEQLATLRNKFRRVQKVRNRQVRSHNN